MAFGFAVMYALALDFASETASGCLPMYFMALSSLAASFTYFSASHYFNESSSGFST